MRHRDLQKDHRAVSKGKIPYIYRKLSFDPLFCTVMKNKSVCMKFINYVTGLNIVSIVHIEEQQTGIMHGDYRTTIFDIIAIDSEGRKYDIEMQVVNKKNLEKRCRVYQAGLDSNMLPKSAEFNDIKDTYIIFVCDFDYFGKGYPIYEKVSHVKDFSDLSWDDGTHVFILNTHYNPKSKAAKATSEEVKEFLGIVRYDDVEWLETDFAKEVADALDEAKKSLDYRRSLMSYLEMANDFRAMGADLKEAEDVINLYTDYIDNGVSSNVALANTSRILKVNLERVKDIIKNSNQVG